jgi:SAM-dependent methyltransferase
VTALAAEVSLDLTHWARPVDAHDVAVLALCRGATLDVGCGPGRLTRSLAARGHRALGIDVAPEAISLARERGVRVLHRDVFAPLPDEGRWETALLADGNLGIGGDPEALLRRLRQLLVPGGRIVAEAAAPGTPSGTGWARLRTGTRFPWAVVDTDALRGHAAAVGLRADVRRLRGRWVGVLEAS